MLASDNNYKFIKYKINTRIQKQRQLNSLFKGFIWYPYVSGQNACGLNHRL